MTPREDLPAAPAEWGAANVLIVDDSAVMRSLMRRALLGALGEGLLVTEATDGYEALRKIVASTNPFDLILSDLYMPRLDGLSLLRSVRSSRRNRPTPFVLVTAHVGDPTADWARREGAAAVLAKPFGFDEFVRAVLRVLQRARAAVRGSRGCECALRTAQRSRAAAPVGAARVTLVAAPPGG